MNAMNGYPPRAASVAQLERAAAFQAADRVLESPRARISSYLVIERPGLSQNPASRETVLPE